MKLSELVQYYNQLAAMVPDESFDTAHREITKIIHVVSNHAIQFPDCRKDLEATYHTIVGGLAKFDLGLKQLKHELWQQWQALEPEYLRESQRLFEHEMPLESNAYILNRRLALDAHDEILLRSRLRALADWRLPGMVLRPGLETFVNDLVALDPLYLVDQHPNLLEPAMTAFTPEYHRRLRPYIIDDRNGNDFLSRLPDAQFGFVFAYNYFNFKPIEVIRSYIEQLAKKLRPGGVMIMTFNNCEREEAVGSCERSFMCYTPARMILDAISAQQLEVQKLYNGLGNVSWLELKRPGEITSIRGGQTLARVIAKSK